MPLRHGFGRVHGAVGAAIVGLLLFGIWFAFVREPESKPVSANDPLVRLVGPTRAPEILARGIVDRLQQATSLYPGYADVAAQTASARSIFLGGADYHEAPPVVLFADVRTFPVGTRLHIDAINPSRKTDAILLWFDIHGRTCEVIYRGWRKDQSLECVTPMLLPIRSLSAAELDRESRAQTQPTASFVLEVPFSRTLQDPVPIPEEDLPVYVSIRDQDGRTSGTVPLHQTWKLGHDRQSTNGRSTH